MARSLIKKIGLAFAFSCMSFGVLWAGGGEAPVPPKQYWKHKGLFGTFDRAAAQRGFQVYREVCSACHGLSLLSYRNLEELGYSENEIKAFASEYSLMDGPNDEGEMFERAATAADRFVPPYPNEKAARAANNGAYPVDLSLITKAREYGEDYIYAILTGYEDPPEGITLPDGMSWNKYFNGHQIAMPKMLSDDGVHYTDGTTASAEQQAYDVAVFLSWAADPHREERLAMGLKTMIFLFVFASLMYAVKRKVWADVK